MSDINDQHQQQQQQQPPPTSAQTAGVGTAIPNVNLGGPTPAPAQPQLQPLTIDPNSAGPPGGQPGNTLAAWAAPHSLLHAEGTAAVAAMQQSAIATLIEGPNQFWSSYYFYDMYRCRDEADEDAGSLMSTVSAVAGSKRTRQQRREDRC